MDFGRSRDASRLSRPIIFFVSKESREAALGFGCLLTGEMRSKILAFNHDYITVFREITVENWADSPGAVGFG